MSSYLRSILTASTVFAALTAPAAFSMEVGVIRPLQHGPIGDSPQYATLGEYEGEGGLVMSRSWGKYTVNSDPDSKVSSSAFKMKVLAGGGMAPTKDFSLTGYIDFTLASDADIEAGRASPESSLDHGPYRHEFALFGLFKPGSLVIGGGLGMLLVGSETREFKYDDDTYRQDITSAAMPVLRLFGGLDTKQFTGTLGLRLFSMGEAVVEAETPTGDKYEYDIVRRNPGEIHADGRFKFGAASVGGSLAYVLTAQSSEQVDEFSLRFTQTGTTKTRRTGGDRRNSDHIRLGIGGRFDPVKMVGILGGLSYIGSSYAKEEYASLEHENLGGVRLDLGTDVHVDKFRGYFQLGYQMDSTASYTVTDGSQAATSIDQTQRPPVSEGDKIKLSQGSWTIALGGGVAL